MIWNAFSGVECWGSGLVFLVRIVGDLEWFFLVLSVGDL